MRAPAERANSIGRKTRWLEPESVTRQESLQDAVRSGLTKEVKELPSRFFYDAEGSRLFELICDLPEYYLTRAETEILKHASNNLASLLPQIEVLVELGSGSAIKTEYLLQAFGDDRSLRYAPIDVSRTALEDSIERLESRHPEIEIWATVAEYESGIAALEEHALGPKLITWLGSSIGNLRRPAANAFLSRRRAAMSSADRMLVGIDLRKDPAVLESAYNDSRGITARFNMNLLTRINRELGARFDLDQFTHRVEYDEVLGSVQSFLESQRDQTVTLSALDLEIRFEAGERIHTEDSYKYSFDEIDDLVDRAGLRVDHRFLDSEGRFSVNLLAASQA